MGNKNLKTKAMGMEGGRPVSKTSLMNPNLYWFMAPCRLNDRILALRINEKEVNKSHFVFEKLLSMSQFGTIWVVRKLP